MFCNYCGTKNPDDAIFCRSCGRRRTAEPSTSPTESTNLPNPSFPEAHIASEQLPGGNMLIAQDTPQESGIPIAQDIPSALPSRLPKVSPPAGNTPSTVLPSLPFQVKNRSGFSRSMLALLIGLVVLVVLGTVSLLANPFRPTATTRPTPTSLSRQSPGDATGKVQTPVSSAVLKDVTGVNPAVLAAVGTGDVQNPLKPISGSPAVLTGPTGKPEIFYLGAEYCPYCAAQRWPIVVALGRFGTFTQLYTTASAPDDTAPNTPTFSFYHSGYTSQYIDFVAVETQGNQRDSSGNYPTLQTPTAEQQQLVAKYNPQGSIPFIDIANQYTVTGSGYSPDVLANMTVDDIAKGLSDQSSAVTRSILGSANYLTAAICNVTNQQPENVCKSSTIQQIELLLGKTTVGSSVRASFV